jgi:HPt (histidine-containing phosphotransfer) domain-containing protein
VPESLHTQAARSRAPSAAAVDRGAVRQLQQQLGPEGVAELATAFLDRTPDRLVGMCAAAGAGDASKLREQAYSLKGAARSFGAAEMGDIAAQIERESAAGSLEHGEELLTDLAASFERTRAELEHELEHRDGAPATEPLDGRMARVGRIAELERRVESLERSVVGLLSRLDD